MAAISKKLRSVQGGRVMFWCPGCDGAHMVCVGEGGGPRWATTAIRPRQRSRLLFWFPTTVEMLASTARRRQSTIHL